MIRRLDRYILGDLVRLVALTTGVLVTVIAFGATIKPLASDKLLTAGQTAKYVVLAIVPMLQFALPFSAGFAGTLSLFRMSSDNEVLAAAVGGISYRRLLAPVIALGLVLTVVMIILTQWIIPRFWAVLEGAIREDVTRIFQASIERGEPFDFGGRQIYADRLIVEPNPPGTEVDTRLILVRVAYADVDDEGRLDKDVTANRAVVDIYRRPGVTYLKLAMAEAVAYNPDDGILAGAELLDFKTIAIPSILEDDARHMTRGEMLELRRNPDRYEPVVHVRLQLADALRDRAMWKQVDAQLGDRREVEMAALGPGGSRVLIRASRLRGGRFGRDGDAPIEAVLSQDGTPRRVFRAGTARLEAHDRGPLAELTFDLVLEACEVTDLADPDTPNRRERVVLENFSFAGFRVDDLAERPSDELLALAEQYPADDADAATVRAKAERLRGKITALNDEITGRLTKRYALSTTVLLLLALGTTLAMVLRESQPLAIYLWAFIPSILDLLLISSGEHMIRDGTIVGGIAVMWLGNVTLLVITLLAYRVLARH